MANLRDQFLCLVGQPGAGIEYMNEFDSYPESVRKRLRNSPINICLACFREMAYRIYTGRERIMSWDIKEKQLLNVIDKIERGDIEQETEDVVNDMSIVQSTYEYEMEVLKWQGVQ